MMIVGAKIILLGEIKEMFEQDVMLLINYTKFNCKMKMNFFFRPNFFISSYTKTIYNLQV